MSDLTYELRSGSPDFVDSMVSMTFGNMAMDAIIGQSQRADGGHRQRLLRNGRRSPIRSSGRARSTSKTMYDTERYRAAYRFKSGLPIFLARA